MARMETLLGDWPEDEDTVTAFVDSMKNEFEVQRNLMRARFQIQISLRLEPDFEYWRQIRIQTKEGNGTCWEESPSLAIDTKVYKRM